MVRSTYHRLPLVVILFTIVLWFSPWWLGGRVLAPLDLQNRMMSPWREAEDGKYAKNHMVSDSLGQYLVYRLIAERDFRNEGRVGWSSLTYGGTAQYANTMALYYDWTMQLHRWLDYWTAWHLGIMGQVMLAAIGMYLFLKSRGIDVFWSTCGALLYAANSQFVLWAYHRWALGSFCWVPWILWSITEYRSGRRSMWAFVPVFIALAFLGGTLQHAALVVFAVAAAWSEEMWNRLKNQSCLQHGKQCADGLWQITGRYVAWGILAAGLSAVMFFPCIDAFLTSNRLGLHTGINVQTGNSPYREGWLQPLLHLISYPMQCFPSIFGRCGSLDVLKLFKSEIFYVAFFGSLPVIIGLVRGWHRQTPKIARVLVILGLMLPLTPLERFLYQRSFLLFILGGIMAFVSFMQMSSRETKSRWARRLAIAGTVGMILWTGLSVLLLTQSARLDHLRSRLVDMGAGSSFGYFTSWLDLRAGNFIDDLFIWSPQHLWPLALFAVILTGLGWSASPQANRARIGKWLIALAVIGESCLFASRWLVWSDPAKDPFFTEVPESRILQSVVGRNGRVTTLMHPTGHMAMTPFVPNTLAAYGIATIHGYDSIVPDGMLIPNETPGDAAKLGRMGVTHLITYAGNPDVPKAWRPIWHSRSMDLYVNPLAVPRYAGFVDDDAKSRFLQGESSSVVPLQEITGMENRRIIEANPEVAWIRIAENHACGWQWRSLPNGQWQDVPSSSDKCLWIPNAGRQVEMRYHPPLQRSGRLVSGICSGVILLSIGFAMRKPRRDASLQFD